ncbi:hypothetical protein ACFLWZ_05870 [Chloroflexota bacterium]
MDTGNNNMETETNNSLGLRIAIGSGLVATGCAITGPAMSDILQADPAPWWSIALMVIGVTAIIVGLSILIISPRKRRRIGQLVRGFPTWRRETKIWKRYGPVCTFGEPKITFNLSEDGQTRVYTAKISLSISLLEKAWNYYPVKVIVDKQTTTFHLEQSRGGVKVSPVSLELVTGTLKQTLINTPSNTPIDLAFSQSPYNNPAIAFVDIQKPPYEWIVEGVEVHLANINKIRKLSKRGKVSNTEREIS